MKRLGYIIPIFLLALFSCEISGVDGPVGPQGPEGPAGQNGEEAFTFEFEIDFEAPDYQVFLPFPGDFQMLESDVALVYLLWGQEEVDEETLDIWRALPQTIITEEGFLQYNFDFTVTDVSLFLDSNYDLSTLGPDFLDDWVVRVVVVPAQFVSTNGRTGLDLTDYHAVAAFFNIPDQPVSHAGSNIKRPV